MRRFFSHPSKPAPLVSFLIPVHQGAEFLEQNIPVLYSFLATHYGNRFEVIIIPNPVPDDKKTLTAARKLAGRFPRVRVCLTAIRPGKGLALKEGFAISRGRWIFTTDADLPYDLEFFLDAERLLRLGVHLVIGNRRLPVSRFRMSKRVLPFVFQRHLVGLLYNLFVRLLLPVKTTDTQAGIKAMTRPTAEEIFRRQVCPHFSYDIEMILTTRGMGRHIVELPVVLHLKNEKSTVRIFKMALRTSYWLQRITLLYWKGRYSRVQNA